MIIRTVNLPDYLYDREGIIVALPISDDLIRDADTHAVAVLARDAAGKQAYDAIYERARALEQE